MTSPEKRNSNRVNACKSTGPKTPEGKAKVARNAITHGLTATPEVAEAVNPGDPSPAYRAGLAEWMDDLKPRGILERTLTVRACRAAWRLGKCDRYEDATAHRRERDAAEAFDLEQQARVAALGRRLIAPATTEVEANANAKMKAKDGDRLAEDDPAAAVAELRMSAAGIDWLIARWGDLARALKRPRGWAEDDEFAAARLLGVRPEEARHHPATRALFPPPPDPREAEAREQLVAAGALRAALEASDAARERGASDPRAIGRRVLAEVMAAERADAASVVAPRRTKVVRAERARLLRLRAKGHDARSREDRAGAADRSLFADARGASLLIRYTTAAGRDLHRSIRDLMALRGRG